jgi:hypothetical protein
MLLVLCFYLAAVSKYSPRHPVLELPQSYFFTQCSKQRRATSLEVTCNILQYADFYIKRQGITYFEQYVVW